MNNTSKEMNRMQMVFILSAILLLIFVLIIIKKPNQYIDTNESNNSIDNSIVDEDIIENETIVDEGSNNIIEEIEEPDELKIVVRTVEGKKKVIYEPEGLGYRYGPSIMNHEDGSVDLWIASPGNSGSEWDWIRYMHSDDGENWSDEQVVLRPTRNSKDQCSTCDPAVIFFNGYYYLGYTSTHDYERNGYDNSVFVARSENPDGLFEKWNGDGWGGDPEPIIEYDDDPDGWGIGEVSFVVKDDELYIYYTYNDGSKFSLYTARADLSEDWPKTIRDKQVAIESKGTDAVEVVYVEDIDTFLAFGINESLKSGSNVLVLQSKDGINFSKTAESECLIDEYSHSMGVEKDGLGHVKTGEELIIGYGFGNIWAKWTGRLRAIVISTE